MTVKLIKKLHYRSEEVNTKFKRKHFSAVIFFDFFFKGKKIISLPQSFNIVPLASNKMDKNSIEDNDLFLSVKYPGIRHYDLKNKYFYLAIAYSFGFDWNDTPRESTFYLLVNFFNHRKGLPIISSNLAVPKSQRYSFSFNISSPIVEEFGAFLEREIGGFVRTHGELVLNSILSSLEENYGEVKRLESRGDSFSEEMGTEDEVFSLINNLNINYCYATPARKTIKLEHYFSDAFLLSFLEEISRCGLSFSNPFGGEIQDSSEEYKEYLLTLYGPGKWEYSNLEIEKLDLTTEELVCLNIVINDFIVCNLVSISSGTPAFFSTEDCSKPFLYQTIPYLFFWYRLNQVVKDNL